jgi:hypothetical protein
MNGTIDEVMIFNSTLNASQVEQIFNNQSRRFASQGNISFWNLDSGANTTLNISIPINQTFMDGEINGSINGETEFRFADGEANVINFTNAGEFNLTLHLYAGNQTTRFYSPVVGGNISIEPFSYAALAAKKVYTFLGELSPDTSNQVPHLDFGANKTLCFGCD